MRLLALALLVAAAHAQGVVSYEKQLQPVAFLVGEHAGKGRHPWGEYDETLTGEWQLKKTLIVIRSKSTMGGRTVFEDLRVLSYDPRRKRIRMRQYAMGDLLVYDVAVEDGGKRIVCTETAHEGNALPSWRYTFTRKGDAFDYQVDAKKNDGSFSKYLGGSLERRVREPGRQGALPFASFRTTVPGADGAALQAEVHFPKGEGPFPTIVMSPGGNAQTTAGYGSYGKWFASWGFVTMIVAFNDRSGAERAAKFSRVLDWATEQNGQDGFILKGKLDLKRLVACGHSRGGYGAVVAARSDPRFKACLALAPSGPREPGEGKNRPAMFVIVGDRDQLQQVCRSVYEGAAKPRYLLTVSGMNHMFGPAGAIQKVVARSTAFLRFQVAGDAKYRAFLVAEKDGITVQADE